MSAWLSRSRRGPAAVAIFLVVLGVLATAVRLDAPSDGSVVRLGWSTWQLDGVVVDVPRAGSGLLAGDLVTGVAGSRFADGLGAVARPRLGTSLSYDVVRQDAGVVAVRVERPDPYPLLAQSWGNLVFCPGEPSACRRCRSWPGSGARGGDDPLDPVDLRLIGALAQQVGTAVQAVRLHDDLARSRAEVVASREDERRRLRRDLHDGLGPALAAIKLKAGLAARAVPDDSPAHAMLDEISAEATAPT
ncbi:hypothetical protein GCM10009555_101100 [Acrocarpospora macrocephala]|uniref:Signal transduction histidine kinase subgroup 3 dimerisation and phosphoacceptor domain-containing protein n=1 Tax=Acrocarpospora macrocephala TaxID=150177 RepID=A0A5M3WDL9_9ACTN|nr:histidine kinase [Acrocarpospora macrocephala]GES07034.1 hypothetical protein Amac_006290 [Acrocarpospora macrocephala]